MAHGPDGERVASLPGDCPNVDDSRVARSFGHQGHHRTPANDPTRPTVPGGGADILTLKVRPQTERSDLYWLEPVDNGGLNPLADYPDRIQYQVRTGSDADTTRWVNAWLDLR